MLSAALVLAAAPCLAQAPAGPDFEVNTYTTGQQFFGHTSVAPSGEFVVTWTSYHDGSHTGIFAQRFDAGGVRQGGEFIVNTYTTGYQIFSIPAVGPRGDFVVAYVDYPLALPVGIDVRRFDAAGAPIGSEFRVSTSPAYGSPLDIARTPDGGFVVAWADYDDGSARGIAARRFDAMGAPLGPQFAVNTFTTGLQRYPAVAADGAGNFIIVWEDENPARDGSGSALAGQRFDAAGNRLGAEFVVNTYTTGDVRGPAVSMAPTGAFVAVWTSQADSTLFGISGRRYDAAGNPIGGEFVVNGYTTGVQVTDWDGVAHDGRGNFAITWTGAGPDGVDVYAQRFDTAGNRRGQEFRVNANTTTSQSQVYGTVRGDAVGNLVVGWEDLSGTDGSGAGMFGRRVGGLYPRALRVDIPGNGVLEPGEAREIRPSWLNATAAPFALVTTLSNAAGPPGGVPVILDPAGAYGTLADGAIGECTACPIVSIPGASPRPALHWDGTVLETVSPDAQGQQKTWTLHVGGSFTDVSTSSPFYRFIETLLHNDVTAGCDPTRYCPVSPTTREQMAVFVLVAKEGPFYLPPACVAGAEVFSDVPASSPFCRWVEELSRRGVVGGCGPGLYCPIAQVTREQMPVFVLRLRDPNLVPPPCVPPNLFNDVPETSPFCPWIEYLAGGGVVVGCGGGNYCPTAPVTREQMAVFLAATFGLQLYGP